MPKLYFTRARNGEPIKYHEAPGANEINIPSGDNPKDYEHLIPEEMLQQPQNSRHPFWDSFIGRFMGGDSGSAAWRVIQLCVGIWMVYQFIGNAEMRLKELSGDTEAVHRHEVGLDSLRKYEQVLGKPEDVSLMQSQVDMSTQIANKHFPRDVKDFRQQMQWSVGVKQFKIDRGDKQ